MSQLMFFILKMYSICVMGEGRKILEHMISKKIGPSLLTSGFSYAIVIVKRCFLEHYGKMGCQVSKRGIQN